ncbi:squalene synthase HpnC [Candidatus Zixiibacteriota bacterium]
MMNAHESDIERAYAQCRALTRQHYENFPIASALLPSQVRRHMYALYGFARGVDDAGDEFEGDRLARLDWWEAHLMAAFGRGEVPPGDHPAAFRALSQSHKELDLPLDPFLRLIEANRRDQRIKRYDSFDDLLEYCTFSADPVGRLVLAVFGFRDEELYPFSDAVCTALQLTNFWQDVGRDYAMGRIYLPAEDLNRFSVSEDDLGHDSATDGFRDLLRFEVERTREYFRRGQPLTRLVAGRFRIDLLLFSRGGESILDAIEAGGFDVLGKRPVLTPLKKGTLILSVLLRFLTGRTR